FRVDPGRLRYMSQVIALTLAKTRRSSQRKMNVDFGCRYRDHWVEDSCKSLIFLEARLSFAIPAFAG
ncbi:hypothetical protein, partial [Escherichia coli]|uniref:hypothetical protein n=1 Tax=Escherichia coli TaxID=562 RepID=UPI001BE40CA3